MHCLMLACAYSPKLLSNRLLVFLLLYVHPLIVTCMVFMNVTRHINEIVYFILWLQTPFKYYIVFVQFLRVHVMYIFLASSPSV